MVARIFAGTFETFTIYGYPISTLNWIVKYRAHCLNMSIKSEVLTSVSVRLIIEYDGTFPGSSLKKLTINFW